MEQERTDLERQRENWRTAEAQLDSVEAWCRLVAVNLGELSYDERRMAVGALGVEARVWARHHDPRYQVTMHLGVVEPTAC